MIYPFHYFMDAGGLMSYGPTLEVRSADYVDLILRGTKAGDLPVQSPRKYELLINRKVARTLDLTIPFSAARARRRDPRVNETIDQADLRPPPGRLFRKYLYSIVALAFAALAINTGFDVWFSYREQKQLLAATQREQAASAAIQIGQFIGQIENQIRWLSRLPPEPSTHEDQRLNAIRLLRLSPAIAEIAELDAQRPRAGAHVAPCRGQDRQQRPTCPTSPAFRGANESRRTITDRSTSSVTPSRS